MTSAPDGGESEPAFVCNRNCRYSRVGRSGRRDIPAGIRVGRSLLSVRSASGQSTGRRSTATTTADDSARERRRGTISGYLQLHLRRGRCTTPDITCIVEDPRRFVAQPPPAGDSAPQSSAPVRAPLRAVRRSPQVAPRRCRLARTDNGSEGEHRRTPGPRTVRSVRERLGYQPR